MPQTGSGALAGIKVLDLTRVVAGPLAGQIFGDLGADVIKVERLGEGDDCRRVGPPWLTTPDGEALEESTYFQAVNRNKRSITVDFSAPEGAKLLQRLAAECDILLENYRPGTLAKYGLGYEALKALNPGLIYCSITGFGQTGPYADRSGYDYLIQGMGGLMSVTGHQEGEPGAGPTRVGVPVVDIFAGLNSVIGVLAALQHRNVTGHGQAVDISLMDSQLAALLNTASAWLNSGATLGRTGNDHPSAAPYGVYEVADGHIIIATFNDREFVRLAAVLGHPEWATDPRFAKNGARVANRPTIKALVQDAVKHMTRAECTAKLNAATVSCGPINAMPDLEHDPQVLGRDMIVGLTHPQMGPIRMIGSPYKMSESPASYRLPPPLMGEHTEEVLKEVLGASDAELRALHEAGAI